MRLNYYPETDSPYIDLAGHSSVESREISDGVVLDYDSRKVDLERLVLSRLPGKVETAAA